MLSVEKLIMTISPNAPTDIIPYNTSLGKMYQFAQNLFIQFY
ncbi:hypothetical protein [Pseudoteredinibacter isoporae]